MSPTDRFELGSESAVSASGERFDPEGDARPRPIAGLRGAVRATLPFSDLS